MARQSGLGGRAAKERTLHQQQLRGYGFLAGRGPRRGSTMIPAPLRYWQYDPPRTVPIAVVVVIVGIWLGAYALAGGWPAVVDEATLALGAGAVVLLFNVGRFTVSDHGMSADVPAARTKASSIVPLAFVREVRLGAAPADWPPPARRGGWLPGRTRVAVRHLDDDGVTGRSFTRWVRDPEAFATAIDHPLPGTSRR